jgi:hypothetical protein
LLKSNVYELLLSLHDFFCFSHAYRSILLHVLALGQSRILAFSRVAIRVYRSRTLPRGIYQAFLLYSIRSYTSSTFSTDYFILIINILILILRSLSVL